MSGRMYQWIGYVLLCTAGVLAAEGQEFHVGQETLEFEDAERGRHWAAELWYPTRIASAPVPPEEAARGVFQPWRGTYGAPVAAGEFPLLVFSHGTGGNRFALAWLMEHMVRQGYVVLSLDHYGNNSGHKIPREFLKWWERAIDVQFVLTELLADPKWSSRIDPDRIGGVGHSLGGYTMIALAGAEVDRTPPGLPNRLPPEFPVTDEKIDYANDPELEDSLARWGKHVKDPRFRAFFVMAPAIGFGFLRDEQTAAVDRPVFIVVGEGDQQTPVATDAGNYHRRLPDSELHLFPSPVGHYVFLNQGTEFGKQVIPMLVVDPPGVDRAKIHAETARLAVRFFAQKL